MHGHAEDKRIMSSADSLGMSGERLKSPAAGTYVSYSSISLA